MSIYYTTTQRGAPMLLYEGYMFTKTRSKDGHSTWRCVYYNSDNCRGRCHVKDEKVIKHSEHNHRPDKLMVQRKLLKNVVNEVAVTTRVAPQKILKGVCNIVGPKMSELLGEKETLKRRIRQKRQSAALKHPPHCPEDIKEDVTKRRKSRCK